MTQEMLASEGVEWSALRNHIPCMAHVIQLCLGAFMKSLGVKGRTKTWEANERDEQFGENEAEPATTAKKLQKIGSARIRKVTAMKPGLSKVIEKVCFLKVCMVSNVF